MHSTRSYIAWFSLFLPVVLSGCSTTMGQRLASTPPQIKQIAVVGDRPVSVASGAPGDQSVVESDPEPRINPKARISGRVLDDQGEPVSGVTVRLADGVTKGGKDIRGTTDKSGAFTLNGLRAGSTYSLIAEAEDDRGALIGRAKAKTAATDVEISLVSEETATKAANRKTSRTSRARPISLGEETGEEGRPGVNREDIGAPTEPSDVLDPGPPSDTGRPQLSAPRELTGWQNHSKSAANIRPKSDEVDSVATSAVDTPRRSRSLPSKVLSEDEEEEPNPLPPAIAPGQEGDEPVSKKPTSARLKPKSKPVARPQADRPDSGEMSLAPDTTSAEKPRASTESPNSVVASELPVLDSAGASLASESGPPAMPDAVVLVKADPKSEVNAEAGPPVIPSLTQPPSSPVVAVASPPGLPPGDVTKPQDFPPTNPAPQPVFVSQATPPSTKAETPASQADYNPFALVAATTTATKPVADRAVKTTSNLAVEAPVDDVASPITPASKTKWGDLAARDVKPKVVAEPARVTLASSIARRFRPAPVEKKAEKGDASVAACVYDAKLRTIKDFRLPDLEGKPVRFQDFDSDLILLDFWGTWCPPCIESIPHLIELQKKYGPKRLQVVGIACEEVAPELRKAKVEEISRKLGINYPVLLSTMDGKPCPVQNAMAIQAMPTMILLNRKGEIIWRSTGATLANESRLDRVLAAQTGRTEPTRR